MKDPSEPPSVAAIVLAAGKGTRMRSELPKVLVPVLGRPMIRYVVESLRAAGVSRLLVVVGYRQDLVREELAGEPDVEFVEQTEQLGTGHAVQMCRPALENHSGPVLIVAGDSPMLESLSIEKLLDGFVVGETACRLGTAHKSDPTGLGRVLRDEDGKFVGIIEHKDANEEQRAITEVNLSTYLFSPQDLDWSLERIDRKNAQGEFYLTDCPGLLLKSGRTVEAFPVLTERETLSINTPEELAAVEAVLRDERSEGL
jgi:bifunctional UDP-N-acetylglucosamine pyrophosphorylase/glucosamine-1-phosphate N-acetyltransferase/UDP-N-acetylglucosamine pyrophosphorylase